MTSKNLLLLLSMAIALSACHPKPHPDAASAATTTEQNGEGPDVLIPDTERNKVSLRGEIAKHQLTVVDFWASWCGPCRQEMPNMVRLHNDFAGKGLAIIGISLDKENAAWQQAIQEMDMKWLQLSALRGWDDDAAKMFGVNAIPHTIVFNQQGSILARGLRGDELHEFIAAQLK